jgi:hypothetical protein
MGFFVLKDYKAIVDVHGIQGMRCILCHGDGKAQRCESSNNSGQKRFYLQPKTWHQQHEKNMWKMNTQLIWHDTNQRSKL